MACRAAMRRTPMASVMVITAGRPFGDDRDREPDHGHEGVGDRVAAQRNGEQEHGSRAGERHQGDLARELVHLADQRRAQLDDIAEQRADPAELGGGPGADGDARPAAGGDEGARERHRVPVAQRRVGRHGGGVLVDRDRFPGQRRLVELQAARADQAQVGRHAVARLQQDDVARHDGLGRNGGAAAVAEHRGTWVDHAADRGQGVLGPALLDEADDGVDQDHRQDDRRVDDVTQKGGDQRRTQEDVDQQVVDLAGQPGEHGAPRRCRQPVGAMAAQARLRFDRVQTLRARGQLGHGLGGIERVPGTLASRRSRHRAYSPFDGPVLDEREAGCNCSAASLPIKPREKPTAWRPTTGPPTSWPRPGATIPTAICARCWRRRNGVRRS